MRARGPVLAACAFVLATSTACGASQEADPATPVAPQSQSSAGASEAPTTSDGGGEQAEQPAEQVVITISDFEFEVPATVPAGAEVTVVNEDSTFHTVTADDGSFDVEAPGGQTVTFTAPEEPGEYPFHCTPHPDMTATLAVG